MSYTIGSFNVRNLSWGAAGSRDLDAISSIIKEFDIIALQEVLSEGKILEGPTLNDTYGQAKAYEYSLKSRLGDNWDMCWLDPKTNSKWYPFLGDDSRGEGYAFIWRKDKFSCPINEDNKEVRPRIIHQYRTDRYGENRLMRDPGYGRFQLVDMPNAEIRLITTHIIYGKPNEDNLSKTIDFGSYMMRRKEFEVLARSIYTSISDDHNDINCVVPYTIILGDYNLNLIESGIGSPFVDPLMIIDSKKNILQTTAELKDDRYYLIHTEQADLTTVNKEADNYSSNYDHFSYDSRTKNSIIPNKPHRLKNAMERVGDFKTYKEKVSDHLPIVLEINLK